MYLFIKRFTPNLCEYGGIVEKNISHGNQLKYILVKQLYAIQIFSILLFLKLNGQALLLMLEMSALWEAEVGNCLSPGV